MREAIPELPQYALVAWCSIKKKHRDTLLSLLCSNIGRREHL